MQFFLANSATLIMLGRYLMAGTFALSAIKTLLSWDDAIAFLKTKDIPFERTILRIAVLWQLIGAGLLLYPSYESVGCMLLIVYSFFATIRFYPFWQMSNIEQYTNTIFFLTNVGLIGGLMVLLARYVS